jgi:hypothetical protein
MPTSSWGDVAIIMSGLSMKLPVIEEDREKEV